MRLNATNWFQAWNYSEGPMTQEQSDPVIDEVREVRRRISARFDNDPARLVAYYMKLQDRHRERLIDPVKATEPTDQSAA